MKSSRLKIIGKDFGPTKPSSFASFTIKTILDFVVTGKTTLIIAAGERRIIKNCFEAKLPALERKERKFCCGGRRSENRQEKGGRREGVLSRYISIIEQERIDLFKCLIVFTPELGISINSNLPLPQSDPSQSPWPDAHCFSFDKDRIQPTHQNAVAVLCVSFLIN